MNKLRQVDKTVGTGSIGVEVTTAKNPWALE